MLFLTVVRSKATLWQGSCQISALQNHCGLGQAAVGARQHAKVFDRLVVFPQKFQAGGSSYIIFDACWVSVHPLGRSLPNFSLAPPLQPRPGSHTALWYSKFGLFGRFAAKN